MNSQTARRYADKIIEWISLFCHRVELAGSLRRECSLHPDVDLLCIPKWESENLLLAHLMSYVEESLGHAAWRNTIGSGPQGIAPSGHDRRFALILPKCKLDIFCATEETFAERWICFTGSKEHNSWLLEKAKAFGSWDPHFGLFRRQPKGRVMPKSEAEFYALLNLPYIEPKNRTAEFLTTQ